MEQIWGSSLQAQPITKNFKLAEFWLMPLFKRKAKKNYFLSAILFAIIVESATCRYCWRARNGNSNHQKVVKQVTMYKIPHTYITTKAVDVWYRDKLKINILHITLYNYHNNFKWWAIYRDHATARLLVRATYFFKLASLIVYFTYLHSCKFHFIMHTLHMQ